MNEPNGFEHYQEVTKALLRAYGVDPDVYAEIVRINMEELGMNYAEAITAAARLMPPPAVLEYVRDLKDEKVQPSDEAWFTFAGMVSRMSRALRLAKERRVSR